MSAKNKKQFGVWMDTHHAVVVGRAGEESGFSVVGKASNAGADGNSNEHAAHNQEKTLLHHYFKEIASHMTNAEEVHVTGPGTAQEQFIHFLADTPQFKNVKATECTTQKMTDEEVVEHIEKNFS
jgi:stalled ribosome rescue protein Dom34